MPDAIATPAPVAAPTTPATAGPSSLYRGNVWRLALATARILPRPIAKSFATLACHAYRLAAPRREQIIFENLLPLFKNDERAARAAARRLFTRFAAKLVDLLQYEAGISMRPRFGELTGWEICERAHARGQGLLMVTPHLGNWEIGSPLLTDKGIKFYAITQPEPGADFTQIRAAARARRGIETIVVGQDAFAFVEIIRRLQEGAAVALLIDRPAPQSAVEVKFCGRSFAASIAAAELARASGCAVVGGIIVDDGTHYAARFLPEFTYDRRALGNRDGRRQFTQQIVSAFEPHIRQYADQWYHFIPIWPK